MISKGYSKGFLFKGYFKVMSTSGDSSSERNTKVYKLRSRKNFPSWKQKTLSTASSKGFKRFLLEDVKIKSEAELDQKKAGYVENV